jgi:hypothetical protein
VSCSPIIQQFSVHFVIFSSYTNAYKTIYTYIYICIHLLFRDRKINPTAHMDVQKALNIQRNLEQKRAMIRGITIPDFKLYYRAMDLAQKQTWRPMEQNRRPWHKLMQIQPFDFWQKNPKHMLNKKSPLQQMVLGKLDIYLQKTETRFQSLTLF